MNSLPIFCMIRSSQENHKTKQTQMCHPRVTNKMQLKTVQLGNQCKQEIFKPVSFIFLPEPALQEVDRKSSLWLAQVQTGLYFFLVPFFFSSLGLPPALQQHFEHLSLIESLHFHTKIALSHELTVVGTAAVEIWERLGEIGWHLKSGEEEKWHNWQSHKRVSQQQEQAQS